METKELTERIISVERRVDRLYHWGASAFLVTSVLFGGYLWFFNKQFDQWQKVQENTAKIQTDILLIRSEQERQSLEATRAWRLINAMIKKEGVRNEID